MDNIYFIADADDEATYNELTAWLNSYGFSQSQVISMSGSDAVAFSLVTAITGIPDLVSSNLIVTSLDVVFGSNFNLRTLVQHAAIRGGDVASYMKPISGLHSNPQTSVTIEKSQVVQVHSAKSNAVLAPLLFLTPSSFPVLGAAVQSGTATDFGSIVSSLIAAGRKVWASEVDFFFQISTTSGLSLADSFLSQPVAPVLVSPAFEGPAARALREVTQTAKRLGIVTNDSAGDLDQSVGTPSEEKKALVSFLAKIASGTFSPTSKLTKTTLPPKFDATLIKHKPRQQHPCYQTTNNLYGISKANEMHMPDTFYPSSQAFSNGFTAPGGSNAASMVTGMRKSKVHSALDEF